MIVIDDSTTAQTLAQRIFRFNRIRPATMNRNSIHFFSNYRFYLICLFCLGYYDSSLSHIPYLFLCVVIRKANQQKKNVNEFRGVMCSIQRVTIN